MSDSMHIEATVEVCSNNDMCAQAYGQRQWCHAAMWLELCKWDLTASSSHDMICWMHLDTFLLQPMLRAVIKANAAAHGASASELCDINHIFWTRKI